MASVPYWRKNTRAWNKPTLGGYVLPGLAKLRPFKFGLRVNEGTASGKDGGSIVIQGLKLPRAVLTLELESEDDNSNWSRLAGVILPVKQPQLRDQLPVYYPTLARYGFNQAIVLEITETPPSSGGPCLIEIELAVIFSGDNATHVPARTQTTSVGQTQAIPLTGSVDRIKDVRDRPFAQGGKPLTP